MHVPEGYVLLSINWSWQDANGYFFLDDLFIEHYDATKPAALSSGHVTLTKPPHPHVGDC